MSHKLTTQFITDNGEVFRENQVLDYLRSAGIPEDLVFVVETLVNKDKEIKDLNYIINELESEVESLNDYIGELEQDLDDAKKKVGIIMKAMKSTSL